MREYDYLSLCYDQFTNDVDYDKWMDFTEHLWKRQGISPVLVLDLGCGTGTLVGKLAGRGYDVIGVDRSPEMLSVAHKKLSDIKFSKRPTLICQDISRIDLYGTVDAAISSLDTMNYLTDEKDFRRALEKVCLFLNPGGSFVFDINTQRKFTDIDGQVYVRQSDDVFCVWQAEYSVKCKECRYMFDIFLRDTQNSWRRFQEIHVERAYEPEKIELMAKGCGFKTVEFWPEYQIKPIDGTEHRIFVVAQK